MEELPLYLGLLFGLIVIATVTWFYLAGKSKTFLLLAIFWVVL